MSVIVMILVQSCSSIKDSGSRDGSGIDQATLEKAIQSRQFIVKFDMMYTYNGPVYLRPRSNYIIVDGENAIISTAYLGRQYGIRPIAGINMRGRASDYEITKKVKRERYDISLKVNNEGTRFDVYLTVGRNGTVSASMNSMRISSARYAGYIVPINRRTQFQDDDMI